MVQENFSNFSATTPKAQFYPPIRLETTPKKSEKEKEEREEKKRTGIPDLIFSSTLETVSELEKPKKVKGHVFINPVRHTVESRLMTGTSFKIQASRYYGYFPFARTKPK